MTARENLPFFFLFENIASSSEYRREKSQNPGGTESQKYYKSSAECRHERTLNLTENPSTSVSKKPDGKSGSVGMATKLKGKQAVCVIGL